MLAAQDADASGAELQTLAAEALQAVYFRDGGAVRQGVLVEFTDIDYVDVAL